MLLVLLLKLIMKSNAKRVLTKLAKSGICLDNSKYSNLMKFNRNPNSLNFQFPTNKLLYYIASYHNLHS